MVGEGPAWSGAAEGRRHCLWLGDGGMGSSSQTRMHLNIKKEGHCSPGDEVLFEQELCGGAEVRGRAG